MTLIPAKTPTFVKKMFSNYVWDISNTDKTIYLTFDDGPTPEITNWSLNILKEYNAKATFFCIGNNIEKHPEVFKNIVNEGHSIGNHTHNHVKDWLTSAKAYLKNIEKAQIILNNQVSNSKSTKLFRPPYGQICPKQGKKLIALGYKIIMWDVISFDWDVNVSKEKCLKNVITNATNGSIIVFHDSIKASKNMQYALPKVLEHFSKLGFEFKAIS
jgi:peptidoglycan/xylan/chitin deacetylase (PgdA/CDA1 family)